MDKNGVIEFRCKKCGRHFWDYLIQNDDNLVVVQAVCMKCDRCASQIPPFVVLWEMKAQWLIQPITNSGWNCSDTLQKVVLLQEL